MNIGDLSIYAFNDKEKEILSKNENIINKKVKLSFKDVKVYFNLKKYEDGINVTDLVKNCLINEGFDVNNPRMYKPRKKPNSDEFYETGSFWGGDEYRVDTFSRSLGKLIKAGLVEKKEHNTYNIYKAVVKE